MIKLSPCHVCGGAFEHVDDVQCVFDDTIIVTSGERCVGCGEEIFTEPDIDKLVRVAKSAGLWGGKSAPLHRKLSKSGRTTVLRIPSDMERNMRIKGDEEVELYQMSKTKFLVEIVHE